MKKNLLYTLGVVAMVSAGAYAVAEETGTPAESQATLECVIQPGGGEAVKSISTINVKLTTDGSTEIYPNEEILGGMTVTAEGGESASPIELGMSEPMPDGEMVVFTYSVMFEPISEPGTYTVTIPEGAFYETGYDDNWEPVPTGKISKAATTTIVVSADAKSNMEFYTLSPADGETVNKISTISIAFDRYTAMDMIQTSEEANIILSNGNKDYKCYAMADWENFDKKYFNITPVDEEENTVVITEAGEWTIEIPAAYFTFDGESSPAIEATFIVDPSYVPEYKVSFDPMNGSTVDNPDGYNLFINLHVDNAEEIVFEPSDADDPGYWRVSYNGVSLKRVDNPRGNSEENYGWNFTNNWGGGDFSILINSQVFEVNGELTIEADKGAFTIDGNPSPAINYTLKVGEVKEYVVSFTPAKSSEVAVADLKNIVMTFENAESAEYVESEAGFSFTVPGAMYPSMPVVTKVEDAEHPSFNLCFERIEEVAALTGGSATLRIFGGSFVLDGVQPCEDIMASWSVKREVEVDLSWTPSPMEGFDIVNAGEGLYATFVFNEFERVSLSSDAAEKVVVKLNGEAIAYGDYKMKVEEGYKLLINLEKDKFGDPSIAGTLQVVIPEGCLTISGTAVPAIDYTWNIVAKKNYEYVLTPSPEKAVGSLAEITVEFPEAAFGEIFNENHISLRKTDYSLYLNVQNVEVVEGTEHATFKLTFAAESLTDGDYALYIHEGAFTLDGSQTSPSISAEYVLDSKLSGVNGIGADFSGKVDVFTLDGRVVMRGADASKLSELGNGIYVVNGKKYIVKK